MVRLPSEKSEGVVYRLDEAIVSNSGLISPGAEDYIRFAAIYTPNIGVVSMRPLEYVDDMLDKLGLSQVVKQRRARDVVQTEEDLYENIAGDLGKRHDQLIAIETNPRGIEAAKRLGYRAIGLALDKDRMPPGELIAAGAEVVAADHLMVNAYVANFLGLNPPRRNAIRS